MLYQIRKTKIYDRLAILALVFATLLVGCQSGNDSKLDQYGGLKAVQGEKTGFFHLEKINDRNWFVTPEGNVFFPVGLSHLYSGESDSACMNVYGGDKEAWLKGAFEKATAMGFNCALGSATSPERNLNGFVDVPKAEKLFRDNNFPYAVGVILLKHPWEFVDGETLPDIYEPSYADLIETRAATICPKYKDDPLVMGYYYGFGAFNRAAGWVNHHLSLKEGSAGRNALVDVLAKRYNNDVALFNATYGTSLSDISQLKGEEVLSYSAKFEKRNFAKVAKTLDQKQLADFEAIIADMCISLYKLGYNAIKKYDTNHLIFGSFVKEWALSPDSWSAAAPYLDMIAPQHFNRDISAKKAADAAGLPVLMSDDYFGWHYPCHDHGGHGGLKSHDVRGDVYKVSLMRHLKDPYTIGVTYCCCMYDQSGNTLKKCNQNGIYDIHGNPRVKLINDITEANKTIYEHAINPAKTDEERDMYNKNFVDIWESNEKGHGLW